MPFGAPSGNRTRVHGLEGRCSAIELLRQMWDTAMPDGIPVGKEAHMILPFWGTPEEKRTKPPESFGAEQGTQTPSVVSGIISIPLPLSGGNKMLSLHQPCINFGIFGSFTTAFPCR